MYDDINNDWVHQSEHQTRPGGGSAQVPPQFQRQPGHYYMGMRLASKSQRVFGGFLTYIPAWALWGFGRTMPDSALGQLMSFVFVIAGLVYCFTVTPQHETQNVDSRKWVGTRVVSVRRDDAGNVRVFYPSNWQLYVRVAMVIAVDAYWGWLSVLCSKTNRTWGDRVARTMVIREGEIDPELPYGEPRKLPWWH